MSDSGPPYGGDSPDMRMDVDIDPQKTKEKALWMVGLDLLSPTARRRSLAAIGVGALVLAVLLVAAPWLPVWLAGPFLPLLVVAQAGKTGIVFLGLVGAAVGLLSLYGKTSPGKPSGSGIDVPDRPRDREIRRTAEPPGNRLNSLVNRVSGDAENPSTGDRSESSCETPRPTFWPTRTISHGTRLWPGSRKAPGPTAGGQQDFSGTRTPRDRGSRRGSATGPAATRSCDRSTRRSTR